MKTRYFLIALSTILTFSGCKDWLDLVPEKDIETFKSIFEKRSGADKWITSSYVIMTNPMFSFLRSADISGADELVGTDYVRNSISLGVQMNVGFKIADGLQMPQDPYDNIWSDQGVYKYIRMCNTFLDRIEDVYNIEMSERNQWTAEIKALKAFLYFELVKRYGPIVLMPKNIGVEASIEQMRFSRRPVDECFEEIVTLLDEALKYLLSDSANPLSRKAYFCRESALALKARVLLYAASPLFNGNEYYANFRNRDGELLFDPEYKLEKWKRAADAANEAIEICEELGRKLIDDRMERNTPLRIIMDNIENSVFNHAYDSKEVLLCAKGGNPINSVTLPRFDANDRDYDEGLFGAVGVSMKMVEMFYTENGLPIRYDKFWDYTNRYRMSKEESFEYQDVVPLGTEVLALHLRREPRFYANIAADRCNWTRGVSEIPYNRNDVVQTRQGERYGLKGKTINSSLPQNITGYWLKKWSDSDVATKGYLNNRRSSTRPLFRLAELYLIKAEALNEYSGPSAEVYQAINVVRRRAGIHDVEVAWAVYSTEPVKHTSQKGMREIIRHEKAVEFAFEGHRYWDLRRWMEAHKELNTLPQGWNVTGATTEAFYNNFEGPINVWSRAKFVSPRDYLYPIKAEEKLVSGVVQNPGW